MRAAVLHFAFSHLDVESAWSDAWKDSHASLAVSRKLGYVDAGTELHYPRGELVEHQVMRLDREHFLPPVPVAVEGLSAALPWFGHQAD